MVVWGRFVKTVISLSIIEGFKRAIYQMKGFFSPLGNSDMDEIRLFLRKYQLKSYLFTFIFLN